MSSMRTLQLRPEYIIFFIGLYFLSIRTVGTTVFCAFFVFQSSGKNNAIISKNLPNKTRYKTIQPIWLHFNLNSNNFFGENKFDSPSKIYLRFKPRPWAISQTYRFRLTTWAWMNRTIWGKWNPSSVILLRVECDPTKTEKSFKTIRIKRFQIDRLPTNILRFNFPFSRIQTLFWNSDKILITEKTSRTTHGIDRLRVGIFITFINLLARLWKHVTVSWCDLFYLYGGREVNGLGFDSFCSYFLFQTLSRPPWRFTWAIELDLNTGAQ